MEGIEVMGLVVRTTGFQDYLSEGTGGAYVKVLVMGSSGAGKTRSASFWPAPIFADLENGRMSIADRAVPYVEINNSAEMFELIKHLEADAAKGNARSYRTLVVDTIDAFQRKVIDERLAKEKKEALSGWADWGYLDLKMTQLVHRIQNLPMNVVVNLHVKESVEDNGDSTQIVYQPKLKGDIRDQIGADFDLVGHMGTYYEVEQGERVLKRAIRWQPEPRFPNLKDRSGRLPRFTSVEFAESDFEQIREAILGEAIEALPEQQIVDQIDVPDEEIVPVGPDETGGPVATPEKLGAKKAPAKKAAKKAAPAAPAKVADATVEPEPEPDDDEEIPGGLPVVEEAATTDDDALGATSAEVAAAVVTPTPEAVAEAVGGEVISDTEKADEPVKTETDGPVCGDQPDYMVGKKEAAPGCGRPGVLQDPKNPIAVLKTGTHLCSDCFAAWKEMN